MCTYCLLADSMFRHDPPWRPHPLNPWHPNIPSPVTNTLNPFWGIDRLKEFQELLERIKKLEDKLGCECVEPAKPDYIKLVEQRIAQLEKRASEQKQQQP
jgi:hypothetical protein